MQNLRKKGETNWAKWEHLKILLDLDDGDDEIRLVKKLTEMHVIREKNTKDESQIRCASVWPEGV